MRSLITSVRDQTNISDRLSITQKSNIKSTWLVLEITYVYMYCLLIAGSLVVAPCGGHLTSYRRYVVAADILAICVGPCVRTHYRMYVCMYVRLYHIAISKLAIFVITYIYICMFCNICIYIYIFRTEPIGNSQ